MTPRKPTARASSRGKYDRAQTATARHNHQRDALLDSATHVFARSGFANASVEAIVAHAGMSRRTFYEHFDDLRDVLHRVHDRAADLAFGFISAQLESRVDPLERIRVGFHAFLGAIAANPDIARVVFREVRAAGPEYEERHERETARYAKLLRGSLQQAHREGKLAHPPDETVVYAFTAGIEAVGMRRLSASAHNSSRDAEALTQAAFRAFGVRE